MLKRLRKSGSLFAPYAGVRVAESGKFISLMLYRFVTVQVTVMLSIKFKPLVQKLGYGSVCRGF